MKAVIYNAYGSADVLKLADLPAPETAAGEVLIKVHAASLNPKDILVRKGKFARFTKSSFPLISGYDVAGEIVGVAKGVTHFRAGEHVFGMRNGWFGGACAEFVSVSADELVHKPASLGWKEAAALPLVSLTALQALRDGIKLCEGERICINGASGGVGTVAIQIARLMGAHVTAICSDRNEKHVLELGAHEVINYKKTDILTLGQTFHAFFDVFGNRTYKDVQRLIPSASRYVTTVPSMRTLFQEGIARLGFPSPRLVVVKSNVRDLLQLREWVLEGKLKPVIDRTFSLEECQEAHRYIETKRARGKVMIDLGV